MSSDENPKIPQIAVAKIRMTSSCQCVSGCWVESLGCTRSTGGGSRLASLEGQIISLLVWEAGGSIIWLSTTKHETSSDWPVDPQTPPIVTTSHTYTTSRGGRGGIVGGYSAAARPVAALFDRSSARSEKVKVLPSTRSRFPPTDVCCSARSASGTHEAPTQNWNYKHREAICSHETCVMQARTKDQ